MYDYTYRHNHIITKEAKQRLKILRFWRQYGLDATKEAFEVKRSTLFGWWRIYKESGYGEESLSPKSQARKNVNKKEIHLLMLKEIRRLRLEECPNMGKAKDPGDLIEIDTIVKFCHGFKRYIITAIDVNSRYLFALAYKDQGSASAKDFFRNWKKVFPYQIKRVQTDNGSEFHKHFMSYLEKQKVIHYWNYKGKPAKNGPVEKYNRTIQEEFIDWNEILLEDVDVFNEKLIDWLSWYNTKRFHWGLNLETPVDYLINNGLLSNMRWTNTSSFQN